MPEDAIDRFIRQSEQQGKTPGENGENPQSPSLRINIPATMKEINRQEVPILELPNLKLGDIVIITTQTPEATLQRSLIVSKESDHQTTIAPHPSKRRTHSMELTDIEENSVDPKVGRETIYPTGSSFGGSALRVDGLIPGTFMEYYTQGPDGWIRHFSPVIKSFEVKRKVDGSYKPISLDELNKLEPTGNLERYESLKKLYDEIMAFPEHGKTVVAKDYTDDITIYPHTYDGQQIGHIDIYDFIKKRKYKLTKHLGSHEGESAYRIEVYDEVWPGENPENTIDKKGFVIDTQKRWHYLISNGQADGVVSILVDKGLNNRENAWIQVDKDGEVSLGQNYLGGSYNNPQAETIAKERIAVKTRKDKIEVRAGRKKMSVPIEPPIEDVRRAAYNAMGKTKKGWGEFFKMLRES